MDKNALKHLKDYWILYLFIANLIITFTTTSSRLVALEARASKNEQLHDNLDINILQIKTDIASINSSLKFLVPPNQK